MKLSIIIPAFNEEATLAEVLDRVGGVILSVGWEKEIIVVDDFSKDGTVEIARLRSEIKLIKHKENQGKGAAVRDGLKAATGEIIIIQDADLEYRPEEYSLLMEPIIKGEAEVVYGSRFLKAGARERMTKRQYFSNKFLTYLSNLFTGLRLTDMETCYKVLSRKVVKKIKDKLVSDRFGIEPEITARVKKYKIKEVPVSYQARSFKEGKKIGAKDGLAAVWHIVRFNLFS